MTISGFVYWLEVLAPYAQAGYLTGALFPEAVYLTNGTDVVRLPRGGWAAPASPRPPNRTRARSRLKR